MQVWADQYPYLSNHKEFDYKIWYIVSLYEFNSVPILIW